MRISDWSSDVCSSDLSIETLGGLVDVELEVTDPSTDNETFFGKLVFVHCDCNGVPMSLHRNPVTNWYSLRCSCGLDIQLEQLGEAYNLILDAMVNDLRSEEHTSELQSINSISYD